MIFAAKYRQGDINYKVVSNRQVHFIPIDGVLGAFMPFIPFTYAIMRRVLQLISFFANFPVKFQGIDCPLGHLGPSDLLDVPLKQGQSIYMEVLWTKAPSNIYTLEQIFD